MAEPNLQTEHHDMIDVKNLTEQAADRPVAFNRGWSD